MQTYLQKIKTLDSLDSSELTALLLEEKVGIIPTDTVYGLVAIVKSQKAVRKMYSLKKRDNKRGTLIAGSVKQLIDLGFDSGHLALVKKYWPGAVSVECSLPTQIIYAGNSQTTIAVRIPKSQELIKLLSKTGPILTTSANLPGEPIANNISEAQSYFKDRVDFYADGDDLSESQPSTIIKVVDNKVELIRAGIVAIEDL
jgi:L-threonylcarbamoyladenylate synthase